MQNSDRCVFPVRSTSRWRSNRSTIHDGTAAAPSNTTVNKILARGEFCLSAQLSERNLEFVQRVCTALVYPGRLAGGPDELPGEQI